MGSVASEYISLMNRYSDVQKGYVIHAKGGFVSWEGHDGIVFVAHDPSELEAQLEEARRNRD